jgi:uncharacterized protein YecT (DUF1311 family)
MTCLRLAAFAALLVPMLACAAPQDEQASPPPTDPTDAALARCDEAAGLVDANYADCRDQAAAAWDARLNAAYGKLEAGLPPDDFAALREAQRHWVAFVEADAKARGEMHDGWGTLDNAIDASVHLDHVRERALELEQLVAMYVSG